MTRVELILVIVAGIVSGVAVGCIEIIGHRKLMRWLNYRACVYVLREANRHYLCGYSLMKMIDTEFMNRFGNFNHEGFCYTFSAAMMLAMKDAKTAQIVRGHMVSDDTKHSWVEFRRFGLWWVVDPCWLSCPVVGRSWYYRELNPQVSVRYSHKEIWGDPAAEVFYRYMLKPETSRIFVNLYWHYTPDRKDAKIRIHNLVDGQKLPLPEANKSYLLFGEECGFWFCQRIVNEFMARPTRKAPKERTLRLLRRHWRRYPTGVE